MLMAKIMIYKTEHNWKWLQAVSVVKFSLLFPKPLQQLGVGVHTTNASHAAWEVGEGVASPRALWAHSEGGPFSCVWNVLDRGIKLIL